MKKLCFPLFALLLLSLPAFIAPTPLPYQNPALPTEERVQDLLSRMTLEEKVAQVMCIWQEKKQLIFDENGQFDAEKTSRNLPHGIGQIGRPSEGKAREIGTTPREMAALTNEIQRHFIENTRLGIPVVFHEECLHGHAARGGTSFPQPIALACSWDVDLVQRLFDMTAHEARARGAHQALTPVVDVVREPRWGRFEETYGEDPYLVSRMGVAAVKGFQGEGPGIDKRHLLATLKHLTGHGWPEAGMNVGPAHLSEREVREVFLPPFKACIQEAGAWSVMASYNEVNSIPSHANHWLLNEVLRGEWGFKGYVVADYGAIGELVGRHHVAADEREAARLAMLAGVDIELPDRKCYPQLQQLVQSGELSLAVLDTAVARLLRGKFALGLFEDPYVDPAHAEEIVGSPPHAALALEAAHKSITLLKNDNQLLPLQPGKYNTIGVIGPNAHAVLLGGYSDQPPYFVTLLDGIKKQAPGSTIRYAEGCRITEPGSWYLDPVQRPDSASEAARLAEAEALAPQCDLIILALGGNELTSREAWVETHLGDRADLQLVGNQLELLRRVKKAGKPIVAVLFNGRPLAINELNRQADAILECWYLGQESGHAVADVLFGEVNPSGKLATTFPRSVGHLPVFYNHKPTARRGYLFDDKSPLFPFGYGLSYTTYAYSKLRLSKDTIGTNESVQVMVDVTNTGKRAGEEIVQLYLRDRVSSVTRPVKELKDFRRVALQPGQTQTVTLSLTPEKLAFFDINMQFVVEPGSFDVMVGPSSVEYQKVELVVQ
ncbi:MAG: beta-glucosidase [Bacteroidetes bacterium]|nr:MAG: beta-glucosidase [Bacteroidota bacterium]